ncbi:MAG: hypothetical protein P4L83_21165 [Nevskia sp.]|nr:hypothetical protein [Nevskia sp.]
MSVVNKLSALVTNHNASPMVQNAVTVEGGRRREIVTSVAIANGDNATSTYRLCRLMSHWRVSSIHVFNTAVTGAAINLGLSRTVADGGAAVAATAYASAQSIATASALGVESAFQNRTVDKIAQSVWADAGAAADTRLAYDLVATLSADAAAAGTLSVRVIYVID